MRFRPDAANQRAPIFPAPERAAKWPRGSRSKQPRLSARLEASQSRFDLISLQTPAMQNRHRHRSLHWAPALTRFSRLFPRRILSAPGSRRAWPQFRLSYRRNRAQTRNALSVSAGIVPETALEQHRSARESTERVLRVHSCQLNRRGCPRFSLSACSFQSARIRGLLAAIDLRAHRRKRDNPCLADSPWGLPQVRQAASPSRPHVVAAIASAVRLLPCQVAIFSSCCNHARNSEG